MILKKRKIYYFDEDQIVMTFNYYVLLISCIFMFALAFFVFSMVINHFVKVYEKKQPIIMDSREVIQLTDLIVKHKLGNGSQLIGKPGNWYLVKKEERIKLK